MKQAFIESLSALAQKDSRIFLVVGDTGFRLVESFQEQFPKQFLNVGIAEQNMIGVATGLALEGYCVFTFAIANFTTLRCFEQIRNDATYHQCNVKLVGIGGGFSYGTLGFTHHATEDLALMRALPNVAVVNPCNSIETKFAVQQIAAHPGVAYLRLEREHPLLEKQNPIIDFKLGKVRRLREGHDFTLLVTGAIAGEAFIAAEKLKEDLGIEVRVESVHTLAPLDRAGILNAVRETQKVLTLEEHSTTGGLGSAVSELLMEEGILPKKFIRLGIREGYAKRVGDAAYLRRQNGIDAAAIQQRVREAVSTSG